MGQKLHHNEHHHPHHHHPHPHEQGPSRRAFLSTLISAAVFVPWAYGQEQSPAEMAERYRQISEEAEAKGLAEPFKGITTNGTVLPGLFQISRTEVSTEPVRIAAEKFISTLNGVQLARTMYPVDDPQWRKWMNQHFYAKQGMSLQEMTNEQRDAAWGLLRASLSGRGFELTRNIMRLNETLAELTGDHNFLGEELYYFTIMGRPSAMEPWGWQLSGHHNIINYFVLGDQVVMTPHFFGSEPVRAPSGKYKGLEILQQEQSDGLAMLGSLPDAQRQKAVLNFSKTGNNNLAEAFKDNIVLDYAGVSAGEMDTPQKRRLTDLIHLYVNNMDEGHARVKMDEVARHMEKTWFAWIGGGGPESVFYYRIHSPVILIEFDHQRPAFLKDVPHPELPNRQHIHCVVRTPNGNDYGKDLLRQHYQGHAH
ncbi:MAG TPA: DUF3500 domain-containing protein [Patescibacteria group bacterium]|nr:DUF3500 domain-containing protein [Patescibacteria group bacterium]